MKAAARQVYGPPEFLRREEMTMPEHGNDDILIRVCAASINFGDWEFL
jgi:NADPH:quinone reductase-like Zn-dependent oxidoreductase